MLARMSVIFYDRWMTVNLRSLSGYLFCFSLAAGVAAAVVSDYNREKEIGNRLQRDLSLGDIVWLETGKTGKTFPALVTFPRIEKEQQSQKAVIMVHGMGGHPDWPDVISPLRRHFYERGNPSLSLQMPILAAGRPYEEYGQTILAAMERLRQGIRYLRNIGYDEIYIVGYGFGATTAAAFLDTETDTSVKAFIGVSILSQKYLKPRPNINRYLQSITIPVLDVYAEHDFRSIRETATERKTAARKNKQTRYSQLMVDKAGHSFTDKTDKLITSIDDWLQKVEFATRIKDMKTRTNDRQ